LPLPKCAALRHYIVNQWWRPNAAARRRVGGPIGEADARIAAIARSRGAGLATRNTDDFADCGLALIDPWL